MKTRNLLLSSIAMLLVAVVALTGGTFAWFSGVNTVTVSSFNTEVVSSSALEAAYTINGTYKSLWSPTDLSTAQDGGVDVFKRPTSKLDAASLAYNGWDTITEDTHSTTAADLANYITATTPGKPAFVVFNKDSESPQLIAAVEGNDFISLKLYFRASIENGKDGTTVSAIDLDKLFTANNNNDIPISKSLRAAYAVRQVVNATGTDVSATSKFVIKGIYAPDNDDQNLELDENQVQDAASDVYGWTVSRAFNSYPIVNKLPADEGSGLNDTAKKSIELFSVENFVERYEVYIFIWIEGFDIDGVNAASGADFDTSLKFEAVGY